MESTLPEGKLVVVLMEESSRWTTKEHFVPPRRYTPYYYNMHKEATFKRSKTIFLASVKSGVHSVTHVSFNF